MFCINLDLTFSSCAAVHDKIQKFIYESGRFTVPVTLCWTLVRTYISQMKNILLERDWHRGLTVPVDDISAR